MNIITYIRTRATERALRKQTARKTSLTEAAESAIQLREYKGALYICYKGTPLIAADHLRNDVIEELYAAREVAVTYESTHND